ncbi:sarcoplasmic calcium-binding protein-like [Mytilus edulis]|uniref:sarcoplasmic calcium-binding protein-like n=1 Tax=Mytilus edulis TaxID=6550 RepID=UPI0039F03609
MEIVPKAYEMFCKQKSELHLKKMDFLKTKWSYWFTLLDVNHDGLITRDDVGQTAGDFPGEENLDETSGKLAAKKILQWWEKYILKGKTSLTKEDFLCRLEKEYTDDQEKFVTEMKAVIKDVAEIVDTDKTESITLDNYIKAFKVWGHEDEAKLQKSFELYKPTNGAIPVKQYEADWVTFYSSTDSANPDPVLKSYEAGFL